MSRRKMASNSARVRDLSPEIIEIIKIIELIKQRSESSPSKKRRIARGLSEIVTKVNEFEEKEEEEEEEGGVVENEEETGDMSDTSEASVAGEMDEKNDEELASADENGIESSVSSVQSVIELPESAISINSEEESHDSLEVSQPEQLNENSEMMKQSEFMEIEELSMDPEINSKETMLEALKAAEEIDTIGEVVDEIIESPTSPEPIDRGLAPESFESPTSPELIDQGLAPETFESPASPEAIDKGLTPDVIEAPESPTSPEIVEMRATSGIIAPPPSPASSTSDQVIKQEVAVDEAVVVVESSSIPNIINGEEISQRPSVIISSGSPQLLMSQQSMIKVPETVENQGQVNEEKSSEEINSLELSSSANHSQLNDISQSAENLSSGGVQLLAENTYECEQSVEPIRVFIPQVWKEEFSEERLSKLVVNVLKKHEKRGGTFITIAGVRTRLNMCPHGNVFFEPVHSDTEASSSININRINLYPEL